MNEWCLLRNNEGMKLLCYSVLAVGTLMLAACSSSNESGIGPVERAGRSVDNAIYKVGEGVEKVGQKIQNAAE